VSRAGARISPGQFFWATAASMVAGGVFLWPMPLLLEAGADWAWALGADGVLVALTLAAQLAWGQRVPGSSMFGRLRTLWGPLAWPWLLGSTALSVVVEAVVLDLFVRMLQTFVLPGTPAWPLRVLLAGLAWVVAAQSLDVLARSLRTWFVVGLAAFMLMVAVTAAHATGAAALHPPWPPSGHGVLAGVAGTWLFWIDDGGVAITLAPFVRGLDWAGARRWALGAVALQLAVVAIVTCVVLTTLGPWAGGAKMWPMIELMVGAGPTSFSFVRPSLLILPVWIGAFVGYLAVHAHSISANTRAAVGVPESARRWHALAITSAVLIVAWQLPDAPTVLTMATQDLSPLALGLSIGLHGLSLLLAIVRPLRQAQPARGS